MTSRWLPTFMCPDCRGPAANGSGTVRCLRCGHHFARRQGVYRFLSMERLQAAEPFARQYRAVRGQDGHRSLSVELLRRLPDPPRPGREALEWRVRQESFANLQHELGRVGRKGLRIVEIGAGNSWLSNRLAELGHDVVAVDRDDDAVDGLGACARYDAPLVAVQADFDALPLAGGQFDAAVFSGSLHYAPDPAATLAEARRLLTPRGVLAVMDSPMFTREEDGRAMVEDETRRLQRAYALGEVIRPGVGFLTFDGLRSAGEAVGVRGRFIRSRGPLTWRAGRALARVRLGRAPAAFGVWVAQ